MSSCCKTADPGCCSGSAAAAPAASGAASESKPSCCTPAKVQSGCCGGPGAVASGSDAPVTGMGAAQIKEQVQFTYGRVAEASLAAAASDQVAMAFGYSAEELADVPPEANMGLQCGNPLAMASIKPGETVLDLGSGGGFDVFQASVKVGPTGKAVGLDMTESMVAKAKSIQAKQPEKYANCDFVLGEITQMPLQDNTIDCVISNCVINLVPEKALAFSEIFRVLKPGGRVAVSDVLLKKPLPDAIARDVIAFAGCISGAEPLELYLKYMKDAGFQAVSVQDSGADLNTFKQQSCGDSGAAADAGVAVSCCGGAPAGAGLQPTDPEVLKALAEADLNEWIFSAKVWAVKPAQEGDAAAAAPAAAPTEKKACCGGGKAAATSGCC